MKRKLTDEQVIQARQMYREGSTLTAISKSMGFTITAISNAVFGRTYSSLPGSLPDTARRGNGKLTAPQVSKAREMYRNGHLLVEIASYLGLSGNNVSAVLNGRTYHNVPNPVSRDEWHPKRGQQGSFSATAKLDEEDAIEIRRRIAKGETHASIANHFGVSRPTVSLIASGKNWAHLGPAVMSPIDNRVHCGSRNAAATLDELTVSYIKAHLKEGVALCWLATAFKTTKQVVGRINKSLTWKRVKPHPNPPPLILSAERELPMRLQGKRLDQAFREWNPSKPYHELAGRLEVMA